MTVVVPGYLGPAQASALLDQVDSMEAFLAQSIGQTDGSTVKGGCGCTYRSSAWRRRCEVFEGASGLPPDLGACDLVVDVGVVGVEDEGVKAHGRGEGISLVLHAEHSCGRRSREIQRMGSIGHALESGRVM